MKLDPSIALYRNYVGIIGRWRATEHVRRPRGIHNVTHYIFSLTSGPIIVSLMVSHLAIASLHTTLLLKRESEVKTPDPIGGRRLPICEQGGLKGTSSRKFRAPFPNSCVMTSTACPGISNRTQRRLVQLASCMSPVISTQPSGNNEHNSNWKARIMCEQHAAALQ